MTLAESREPTPRTAGNPEFTPPEIGALARRSAARARAGLGPHWRRGRPHQSAR
jgi:hypothetical protein